MKIAFRIFLIILFLFIALVAFLMSPYFAFSQSATPTIKISFPYEIKFTEEELKVLRSLSQTEIDKLVQIAKLTKDKNIEDAKKKLADAQAEAQKKQQELQQSITAQNYGNVNQSQNNQPALYSNSPTSQTPYYNPQTGQYQSTPANNQNSSYLNPYTTENPYFTNTSAYNTQQDNSILGNLINGITRVTNPTSQNTDLSSMNFSVVCKKTGFEGGISNPNNNSWGNVNKKLKEDVVFVSSVIGKKPTLVSGWRSQSQQDSICASGGTGAKACGVGGSRHSQGLAVDLRFDNFSMEEKTKTILLFMSKGWSIGSYGETGHIHIGLDGGEKNWIMFGNAPTYVKAAYQLSAPVNNLSREEISKRANLGLGKFCNGNG